LQVPFFLLKTTGKNILLSLLDMQLKITRSFEKSQLSALSLYHPISKKLHRLIEESLSIFFLQQEIPLA
jgi:hypothetical protein